jgi:predicted dehydrogenase
MVRLAVVGAGNRGAGYARRAVADGGAEIVAVADPRPERRRRIPGATREYADWRELAAAPKQADAVIIATQDTEHVEPAVRFAELGYHVLLEKPMAVRLEDCRRIAEAAERAGVVLAVCHVLRYTPYTQQVKEIVDSGRIGDVVNVQHLEPVGWWHHAHSFVRGNWRNTDESTFMLLSKSCHDLDWLTYIVDQPVRRVSSFGGLYHFRPENQPVGAGDRCVDCLVEADCPYSAVRIYQNALRLGLEDWPIRVLTDDVSPDGVTAALRTGPYGRCAYKCDNDVVDHQVVNLEFEGGATASFTMSAFTPSEHRKTRIGGTHGYIEGDGVRIRVHEFRSQLDSGGLGGNPVEIDTSATGATAADGHGGGDAGLVEAFLRAVADGNPGAVLSSARDSLHSHVVAWAAEESRLTGRVVSV